MSSAPNKPTRFPFDIAISFAGESRARAQDLRDFLVAAKFKVFYDRDYEPVMVGQNGAEYLNHVYGRDSRYCLVLMSRQYDEREWTRLERAAIEARELHGESGVLIPVKMENYIPEWLSKYRIYFDLTSRSISELIQLIKVRFELDTMPMLSGSKPVKRELVDISGQWSSSEKIGHMHERHGTMEFRQDGEILSGTAVLTESYGYEKKKLAFDLHGAVEATTNTIRFTSALESRSPDDMLQYSVDKFMGRLLNHFRIEGICADERGMQGSFVLTRNR